MDTPYLEDFFDVKRLVTLRARPGALFAVASSPRQEYAINTHGSRRATVIDMGRVYQTFHGNFLGLCCRISRSPFSRAHVAGHLCFIFIQQFHFWAPARA